MRRRGATVVFATAGLLVIGLIAVFALALANTQAKSRRDVVNRVHERAGLAAALIDSLFNAVGQQVAQAEVTYGGRVVSDRRLEANRQTNAYLALLDANGRVLASSRGFTAQARAELTSSPAPGLIRSRRLYALGNLLPYGNTGVIDLALAFPTRYGTRVLLEGISPPALGAFLAGDLQQIPGVKGAHNLIIDGHNTVLASNTRAAPMGARLDKPAQLAALSRSSGDRNGRYYVLVPLTNSPWRIVLSAPDGRLFASVSGFRKWVPWLIFIAFALVALVALLLGRRVLRSAEHDLSDANTRLEGVNRELAISNLALERRADELARSNAELEQFASIASHDLQEPLRKVRTFTQQLAATESDRLSDKGRDYVERANAAADRMQQLIQDLLAFSRVSTQGRSLTAVDLEQVTRQTLDDLSLELERSGAKVDVGPMPTISGDAFQMQQLIQNLVSNAVKFRREGVAPEIRISATVTDEWIMLSVADNGIGFEPEYAGRIFRVFERLHGRLEYPGTGIGLALCRKIAERHGGSVVAEGRPGVGATFTVLLPVRHAADAGSKAGPAADAGVQTDREEGHVHA